MEVVTKVACCSLVAGGGGVTGAYGVYRISKAHDDEEETASKESKNTESQHAESSTAQAGNPPTSGGGSTG